MKSALIMVLGCLLALPGTLATAADGGWQSVQRDGQRMVTGSGRIVTQQRAVGNFSRVELRGSTDIEVRLGAAPSLAVRADDNILQQITSRVENGTLILDTRGSFRTRTSPRAFVTVPNLDSLASRGSGNADIAGIANRRIELQLQGSGNIKAIGRTEEIRVALRGSGNIDTRQLSAGVADVSLTGSGNVYVVTNGVLNGRAVGSGNIYVEGQPSVRNVKESGSGKVIFSR
jgi:hypothetical protein